MTKYPTLRDGVYLTFMLVSAFYRCAVVWRTQQCIALVTSKERSSVCLGKTCQLQRHSHVKRGPFSAREKRRSGGPIFRVILRFDSYVRCLSLAATGIEEIFFFLVFLSRDTIATLLCIGIPFVHYINFSLVLLCRPPRFGA